MTDDPFATSDTAQAPDPFAATQSAPAAPAPKQPAPKPTPVKATPAKVTPAKVTAAPAADPFGTGAPQASLTTAAPAAPAADPFAATANAPAASTPSPMTKKSTSKPTPLPARTNDLVVDAQSGVNTKVSDEVQNAPLSPGVADVVTLATEKNATNAALARLKERVPYIKQEWLSVEGQTRWIALMDTMENATPPITFPADRRTMRHIRSGGFFEPDFNKWAAQHYKPEDLTLPSKADIERAAIHALYEKDPSTLPGKKYDQSVVDKIWNQKPRPATFSPYKIAQKAVEVRPTLEAEAFEKINTAHKQYAEYVIGFTEGWVSERLLDRKLKQATEKQQLAEKEAQEKALKEKPKTLVDKDGEWAQWLQGVPLIGQILYGEDGPGSEIAKQVLPNPAYRRTFGDDPFKIPTPEEYKKTNGLADRNKWASDRTQKILDDSVEANKKNPTIAILSATEASDQAQKEYAAATGQEYEAYVELMRKNQGKILFDRDKEAVGDFSALSVVASGAVGFLIGLKSKGGSSAAAATAIGRSVRDSIKKGDAAEVAAGLQRLNAVGPINVSTVLTGNKLAMVAAGGAAHEGVMTIAVLHDYYTGNDERKKNYAKEYVVYWTYTDEKGKTVEKTMHGPWAVIAERFPTTFGTGAFTGLLAGLTTKSVLVLRVPNIAKLENAAAPVLRKSGISVDDVVAPAAPAPTPATAPNVVPFPGSKPAAASTR